MLSNVLKTDRLPIACQAVARPCYCLATAQQKKLSEKFSLSFLFLMVGIVGFEPTTPCSQSRCANQAALHPVTMGIITYIFNIWEKFGSACILIYDDKKGAFRLPLNSCFTLLLPRLPHQDLHLLRPDLHHSYEASFFRLPYLARPLSRSLPRRNMSLPRQKQRER